MLKDILNELNESNSSNYKLDILKKYKDNSELKKLLELTYNRNKYNFNVSKNCIIKDNPSILESNASKTVDELSTIIEEEHSNIQIAYLGKFTLTYYSKEQFPSATYTGVMPQAGITVAVDPNLIPLGSQLYINGLGVRYAQDTGGKIKGNNIDVFVDTTAEAIKLGRKQQIDVWILKS